MKRGINTVCGLCLNIHEQEDNQLNREISKEILSPMLYN